MTGDCRSPNITIDTCFRVMGESLDPDHISKELGITPTYSHRKGDTHISPAGRRFSNRSEGIWIFEPTAESHCSVEVQLHSLADALKDKRQSLDNFRVEGLRMDFLVGITGMSEPIAFSIDERLLSKIAGLGIPLEFDLYPS